MPFSEILNCAVYVNLEFVYGVIGFSADECEFRVWCHYNVIDGGITDSNYVDGIEVAADNNGFTDFKRPSGINNYDLINRVTTKGSDVYAELRDGLVEGTDYILLPKAVWNQLHAW